MRTFLSSKGVFCQASSFSQDHSKEKSLFDDEPRNFNTRWGAKIADRNHNNRSDEMKRMKLTVIHGKTTLFVLRHYRSSEKSKSEIAMRPHFFCRDDI